MKRKRTLDCGCVYKGKKRLRPCFHHAMVESQRHRADEYTYVCYRKDTP